MKILYFSWIKDGIGKSQEDITLNENIKNISDLIDFLITINDDYKKIFSDLSSIKFSKNMNIVDINEKIKNEDEIAFFPPMTGG
ncbi:MAG: molybdopterin synthase sulfur carrier subunit [Pelagibacterales bacterium]|nr:molybdopterin synthase sulfur carrier subunit [Pelagibacterales bacterium]|tara:strand:+ start:2980 stop:3231 length:252 start_codon:yes stop_codon:yes gene_type:complete